MNKNLAIIIITYNATKWLNSCLDSCRNNTVIVVDNASSDETVAIIKRDYPKVHLIEQSQNLGFGQANNIGIRYALDAGAQHVFLLNQDAYLVDDVLEKLLSFQNNNMEFGILSPMHITSNKKKLDLNFSGYMLREKTGQFYSDFVLGNDIKEVYEIPFMNAAGWLLSKKCLVTVGGFDPIFFHYGEDNNYCQRVYFHGFKIGVVSDTYIIHDREDREFRKPEVFTEDYFKNVEKKYKVEFADINKVNQIDLQIKKLRKVILKLRLQFKLERASMFQKELNLLKALKPKIELSRAINCKPGAHYL
jgi:GT2 family glycosyltransferase